MKLKLTFFILNLLLTCFLIIISSSIYYLFAVFPNAKLEEIIFHLKAPTGTLTSEQLYPFFINFGLTAVITATVFIIACKFTKSFKKCLLVLTLLVLIYSAYALVRLNFYKYIQNSAEYSSFIEDNYVDPNDVEISFPDKKRNLIFLILESIELSFSDKRYGGYFEQNRIPELCKIAADGNSFNGMSDTLNGAIPVYGTTWTMGAVFGFTAGLPLQVSVAPNSMSTQQHFFKNVTTLGDILHKNGYENFAMKGSDMTFAGAELFFSDHGNTKSIDYKYCLNNGIIPKDYYVWWGFEDKKLFEIAKKQITAEAEKGKPFSFTIFTNDTHMEDGYLSDFCPKRFDDKYSNVINCTSMQVSEFIDWLKFQPFYQDTTVVVVGDHLTMDADYGTNIDQKYKRKVYTNIINSRTHLVNNKYRKYTTFDLFPTILASLGATISGDRLGMGVNLYSDKPTLIETMDEDTLNEGLMKKSVFMQYLSQIRDKKLLSEDNEDVVTDYLLDLSDEEYKSLLVLLKSENYVAFLKSLSNLLKYDRFVAFLSVRNGAETIDGPLNKQIYDIMQNELKVKLDFFNHSNASIIATLHSSGVEVEYDDHKPIKIEKELDSHKVKMISSGRGNYAYINIDGIEYSANGKGFNIVVYDKKSDIVVVVNVVNPNLSAK